MALSALAGSIRLARRPGAKLAAAAHPAGRPTSLGASRMAPAWFPPVGGESRRSARGFRTVSVPVVIRSDEGTDHCPTDPVPSDHCAADTRHIMPDRVERQYDFLSTQTVRTRLAGNRMDERQQRSVSAWIGEKGCDFLAQLVESPDERRRPRTTRSASGARMRRSSPFHRRAQVEGALRYLGIRRLRSVRSRTEQHGGREPSVNAAFSTFANSREAGRWVRAPRNAPHSQEYLDHEAFAPSCKASHYRAGCGHIHPHGLRARCFQCVRS